jgi:hypothetical protein
MVKPVIENYVNQCHTYWENKYHNHGVGCKKEVIEFNLLYITDPAFRAQWIYVFREHSILHVPWYWMYTVQATRVAQRRIDRPLPMSLSSVVSQSNSIPRILFFPQQTTPHFSLRCLQYSSSTVAKYCRVSWSGNPSITFFMSLIITSWRHLGEFR